MKDSRLYLIHIRDCLAKIIEFTKGGKDEFFNNVLIQDAVLRNLEVMGQSIKKLPDEWKSSQPEIAWVQVGNFRNVLAHDYLEVDLDVVWAIIENYLPDLQWAIENISHQFWHD